MKLSRVAAVAAVAATACLTSVAPAAASTAEEGPKVAQASHPRWDRYVLVTRPNENVNNFQRRTVWCPAGWRVVGGGAEAQGGEAILVGSFPTDDQRGWIGLGRQPNGTTVGISVYAICTR
jgi:hypothetical protein